MWHTVGDTTLTLLLTVSLVSNVDVFCTEMTIKEHMKNCITYIRNWGVLQY